VSVLAPDQTLDLESEGVRLQVEVRGQGGPTVLLLPTWTIVHRRFWKAQVPFLARHFRVVTFDGPGNGGSDRPLDPSAYAHDTQVRHAVAVLDATHTDRAVVVGLSQGCSWALQLAAQHRERVNGAVFVAPAMALTDGHAVRAAPGDPVELPESRVPAIERDPVEHWAKYDPDYWRDRYEDFLWFFFGMCFPEPHSTKQVEDCVAWGLETTPEVLVAENQAARPTRHELEAWCACVRCPVLAIHGDQDLISPLSRALRVAELTRGEVVVLKGSGHIPLARDPVKVNLLIRDFVRRTGA
jgi:pimeloyl-ACP methyl ester carboxylesterase